MKLDAMKTSGVGLITCVVYDVKFAVYDLKYYTQ